MEPRQRHVRSDAHVRATIPLGVATAGDRSATLTTDFGDFLQDLAACGRVESSEAARTAVRKRSGQHHRAGARGNELADVERREGVQIRAGGSVGLVGSDGGVSKCALANL